MKTNAFASMKREEARQHFEHYVNDSEAGLDRLRTMVTAIDRAIEFDCSADSLVSVWSWFLDNASTLDGSARTGATPTWLAPLNDPLTDSLTAETLWMVDGLAYYLAACLQAAVPASAWMMADAPKIRNYVFQHQPVLSGFASAVNPLSMILGLVGKAVVRREVRHPGQLRDLYEAVVARARS